MDGTSVVRRREVKVPGLVKGVRQVAVRLGHVRLERDARPRVQYALVVRLELKVNRAQQQEDIRHRRLHEVGAVAVSQGVSVVPGLVELVRAESKAPALAGSAVATARSWATHPTGTPHCWSCLCRLTDGHELRRRQLQRVDPVEVPVPIVGLEGGRQDVRAEVPARRRERRVGHHGGRRSVRGRGELTPLLPGGREGWIRDS